MNSTRLNNYLATVKIDPASCRDFEDEAFQALFGLVNYAQGTDAQRSAWYQAVWNAHFNASGGLTEGASNKSFFFSAVVNRKNSAFGPSLKVAAQGTIDAGLYPWVLDDRAFDKMNAEVKQGKGLAGDRPTTWKDVTDSSNKWEEDHGLSTPVAGLGWVIVTGLIKKYAPGAAAMLLGPEVSAGVAAAAFTAVEFRNWTIRINNAAVKANFSTDERRRNFDRTTPAGQFEIAAAP